MKDTVLVRDPLVFLLALAACCWSTVAAAATWNSPLVFIGVPPALAFMAIAGSAGGLIVQPPVVTRRTMIALTVAFAFIATCATIAISAVPAFAFIKDVEPAVGGILAFFAQTLVPAARARLTREVSGQGATDQASGGSP
jgi:hypothetical protein